jgi:hypothetical protein
MMEGACTFMMEGACSFMMEGACSFMMEGACPFIRISGLIARSGSLHVSRAARRIRVPSSDLDGAHMCHTGA